MLDNRLVTPYADDGLDMVTLPDGLTVIKEINHDTSTQLCIDWAFEDAPNGKPWIQNFFDLAIAGKHDETIKAILDCATEAGNDSYAQECWMEDQRRCK